MKIDPIPSTSRPSGAVHMGMLVHILGTAALFSVSLMIAAIWLASTPAWSTSFLERGREYYDQGDLRSAAIELKNALQRNPDNAEARFLLGRVHFETGNYAGAEKELKRAEELGLQRGEIQTLLARTRLALRDFSAVLGGNDPNLDIRSPIMQDFLVARGAALFALGKPREAESAFQDVLNVAPHARAYAGLARIDYANGRFANAVKHIEKAIAVDPNISEIHTLAGAIYAITGRSADSTQALNRALELDPENVDALIGLALLRLQQRDYRSAEEFITRSLGLPGTRISHTVLKSYLDLAQHNYDHARSLAEGVLAFDPINLTALYVAGVASYALNDMEQARNRLAQYLGAVPRDVQARELMEHVKTALANAATMSRQSGTPGAIDAEGRPLLDILSIDALNAGAAQINVRSLEVFVRQAPANPSLYARLSRARTESGDLVRAREEIAKAVELDTGLEHIGEVDRAAASLILAHLRNREFETASELSNALRQRSAENPAAYSIAALVYAEMGDTEQAVGTLEDGLKRLPGSPVLLGNLAALEVQRGKMQRAFELLNESLNANGEHFATLMRLASIYFGIADYDEAFGWAQRAGNASERSISPKVIMARSLVLSGELQRGLDLARETLEIAPNDRRLRETLGEAQFRLGQGAAAMATFHRLVEEAPYSVRAHFFLARSYALVGQTENAWPEFDKALEINPNHYPTRLAYARLALVESDPARAAPHVQSLTAQFANNPEVNEVAGQLALAQGRLEPAIDLLTRAQEDFESGGVYRISITKSLFEAYWRNEEWEEALGVLERWLERDAENIDVRLQLAVSFLQLGERHLAESQFSHIVGQQPDNWIANNELALLLLEKGEVSTAMHHAKAALESAGNAPPVMDTLGAVLLADGSVSEAREILEEAHKLAPDDPDIALHLSEAWIQSGESSQAKKLLDRFIAESGSFSTRNRMQELRDELN